MSVQAAGAAESWSSYLYRGASKATSATIAGFCIGANPASAVTSGGVALALFFALDNNRCEKISKWHGTTLASLYLLSPVLISYRLGYPFAALGSSVGKHRAEKHFINLISSCNAFNVPNAASKTALVENDTDKLLLNAGFTLAFTSTAKAILLWAFCRR